MQLQRKSELLDWIHWLKTAGLASALAVGCWGNRLDAAEWAVASPNGAIRATVALDEKPGTISYHVSSRGMTVIEKSPLGITTSQGDFTSGMAVASNAVLEINETFLKQVPSAWDETRFLDGYPGSHAVYARRKGKDWFVGGMTDQPRTARLPLGFLGSDASYQAQIYRDGATPTNLVIETKTVTRESSLDVSMLQHGGFAVHLQRAK